MDNESFNRAVDFQSWEDWAGWHQKHSGQFEEWKRQIVATIERNGFVEPLTQQHADPKAIKIITGNYRESRTHNGLNSRKRGLLLEFDRIRQTDTRFADQNVRIFAPEALSRTALIFRGLYPYFLVPSTFLTCKSGASIIRSSMLTCSGSICPTGFLILS